MKAAHYGQCPGAPVGTGSRKVVQREDALNLRPDDDERREEGFAPEEADQTSHHVVPLYGCRSGAELGCCVKKMTLSSTPKMVKYILGQAL